MRAPHRWRREVASGSRPVREDPRQARVCRGDTGGPFCAGETRGVPRPGDTDRQWVSVGCRHVPVPSREGTTEKEACPSHAEWVRASQPAICSGGGGEFGVGVEFVDEAVEGFGAAVVFEEEVDFAVVVAPAAVAVGLDDVAPGVGTAVKSVHVQPRRADDGQRRDSPPAHAPLPGVPLGDPLRNTGQTGHVTSPLPQIAPQPRTRPGDERV